MIFSIIIILLVGVIGYFYFAQGLFTATISAVSAVLAATLAISYFEPLTNIAFQNKFVDTGNAISLIGIFAVSFLVLRTVFDKLIPGNIRLQSTVDSVGGAIMGLVVAVFATGIVAIAAQSMPFGTVIMGQSRFKTAEQRNVQVPVRNGQALDETVNDELVSEKLDPADRQTLLLPVDDWVVGFVSYLSNGGSLAGANTLTSVHPSLLDEYFGQRIGIQPGASHVIVNTAAHPAVSVPLAYELPRVAEADAVMKQVRGPKLRSLVPELKAENGDVILVIRVMFTRAAEESDTDGIVRFSCGSIRLVAGGTDYTPIGTMDQDGVLRINKPDDPLAVGVSDADHGADVVFHVPSADILDGGASGAAVASPAGKPASSGAMFKQGVFLDVKREARIDLSGKELVPPPAPDKSLNVLRQNGLTPPSASAGVVEPVAANAPQVFDFDHIEVSPKLFHAVAVGLFDGSAAEVTFASGNAYVEDHRFTHCQINPVQPLSVLANADNPITEVAVPAGMQAVQVVGTPPPTTDDPWAWAANLGSFSLVDLTGNAHSPAGAFAKVLKDQQPMLVGAYEENGSTPAIARSIDARPTDVWLVFLTPLHAGIRELDYGGRRLAAINQPA